MVLLVAVVPYPRRLWYSLVWCCLAVRFCSYGCHGASPDDNLRITEFLASNKHMLEDEDNELSDWIELWNAHPTESVQLLDLALTDDVTNPSKWIFPAVLLEPNEYIVVFASGKDRRDGSQQLHTNFKLSKDGEYLGLVDTNTGTILHEYAPVFPPQDDDISYGVDDTGSEGFFLVPTPGARNQGSVVSIPPNIVQEVRFSVERGFQTDAFLLELLSDTDSVQIRYTTDGTAPTESQGQEYVTPFTISSTTNVRAVAYRPDIATPARVTTASYIFLADVIRQPATMPNFPVGLQRQVRRSPELYATLDMAMDQTIVEEYIDEIEDGMRSIPSLVVSTDPDNFWGEDAFYDTTLEVEKQVSMEVLYPDGTHEQVDAGCQGHSHNYLRRSMRLNFRSDYGTRVWNTGFFQEHSPLHKESATRHFRTVVLRGGNARSWTRVTTDTKASSYTVDEFARASQIEMSGYGSRGVFVHLYLNNVYWGLYNAVERPDDHWAETYLGGDEDGYFFTNHGGAGSKDDSRWRYLIDDLTRKDLSTAANYEEIQNYLDVEAFADYCILQFYLGNDDWPHNNWYVTGRMESSPLGASPFLFTMWDAEKAFVPFDGAGVPEAFQEPGYCYNDSRKVEITQLLEALRDNESFRTMLADRALYHAENALAPSAAAERWRVLNNGIRSAMIGESARWGDALKESVEFNPLLGTTRTRNEFWQNFVDQVQDDILPRNTAQMIQSLTDNGMLGDNIAGLECKNFLSMVCLLREQCWWQSVEAHWMEQITNLRALLPF